MREICMLDPSSVMERFAAISFPMLSLTTWTPLLPAALINSLPLNWEQVLFWGQEAQKSTLFGVIS